MHQQAGAVTVGLGEQFALVVTDEGRAVEIHLQRWIGGRGFPADAVGRHHRQDVGRRMTAHGHLPMVAGVQARTARFRADRCGKQQDLGAHQGQATCRLGEPLIPADAHADAAERGVPDTETGVAGAEIFFLLIADGVGNVGFAVNTQQASIGVGHAKRIEIRVAGLLEPAQRQDHAQLPRQCGKALEDRAFAKLLGQGQVLVILLDAEIRRGKQLLQQDDLGTLGRCLADKLFGLVEVVFQVPGARHLGGGDCQERHRFNPPAARQAVAG
ncbi:hypothetical protein D3C86_600550 [compost metagenome]